MHKCKFWHVFWTCKTEIGQNFACVEVKIVKTYLLISKDAGKDNNCISYCLWSNCWVCWTNFNWFFFKSQVNFLPSTNTSRALEGTALWFHYVCHTPTTGAGMCRYIPWQFVGDKHKKQESEECTGGVWIFADSAILQYKVLEEHSYTYKLCLSYKRNSILGFLASPATCDEIPSVDPNKKFPVHFPEN